MGAFSARASAGTPFIGALGQALRLPALELHPGAEEYLGTVGIDRPRLILVLSVIFQLVVGDVERIDGQRDILGQGKIERPVELTIIVLVLRRAAVQADEVMRPVGVGEPGAQAAFVVIADQIIGELGGADERVAVSVVPIDISGVRLETEAIGDRLLYLKLDAGKLTGMLLGDEIL